VGPARRRGLLRLLAVVVAVVLLVVLIFNLRDGSSGSGAHLAGAGPGTGQQLTAVARLAPRRLPAPVSGETVVAQPGGAILVIGGLDSGDVSASGVFRLDARSGTLTVAGSLAQPLHDAAAAVVGGRILVLGGGSTTTVDAVESLTPGSTGQLVGHLPTPRSDLSAATVGARVYVLGGYDGQNPVRPVLQTSDGRHFTMIADLAAPVRYAAVAAIGSTLYVFGGELADGRDSDEIQAIDLANHSTNVVGRMPKPISHTSAVVLGGRIYVLGGRSRGSATSRILTFDPASHGVRSAGRLPLAVTNAAAATSGKTAYLIGGLGAGAKPLASVITVRLRSPSG
jgi:Kelch motif protein